MPTEPLHVGIGLPTQRAQTFTTACLMMSQRGSPKQQNIARSRRLCSAEGSAPHTVLALKVCSRSQGSRSGLSRVEKSGEDIVDLSRFAVTASSVSLSS